MYAQTPSALEKHTNVITSTINKISEAIQDLKKNYCIAKISVQSPVINPEIMSSENCLLNLVFPPLNSNDVM